MTLTIEKVGTAGQAYRISDGVGRFDVRTQSSRRYLVVNIRGHYVEKRTDDAQVAERERQRDPLNRIVIDRSLYR